MTNNKMSNDKYQYFCVRLIRILYVDNSNKRGNVHVSSRKTYGLPKARVLFEESLRISKTHVDVIRLIYDYLLRITERTFLIRADIFYAITPNY